MSDLILGYDDLKAINPGLIMASITELGNEYPYKDWKGSNLVDFAWSGFSKVTDNPSWINDPRFADQLSRLKNVDELDKLVEEWTSTRNATDVMNTLQAAGVPAGAAQRAPETIADPQLQHDVAFVELEHPVAGKRLYPNVAFRMSEAGGFKSTPAPLLGQHTIEICRNLLGMSEKSACNLADEGILYLADI
jgi:benzylsuccinate CoA-transferase BbsF subunit